MQATRKNSFVNSETSIFETTRIGEVLLVSLITDGTENKRYPCKLIGYSVGQSILCSAPIQGGKPLFVRDGQAVAVRLVTGTQAIAFTSNVLKSNGQPYPYLHIAPPKRIEKAAIRSSVRATVDISASVEVVPENGDPIESMVTINNLSESGAGFYSNAAIGNSTDKIILKVNVEIATIPKQLTMPGIIRNVCCENESTESPTYNYGVQLQIKDKTDQLFLNAYINQCIVQQMYS